LYNDGVKVDQESAHKIKSDIQILNLGCGNSYLSENMYDEGYLNITNNDISTYCIKQMIERYGDSRAVMKWHIMDARDMTYKDN
jgi:EEF1A lysine methyltransferase 4